MKDPAGVMFDKLEKELRINKKHAKFVQVLHSDVNWLGTSLFGEAHMDIILNDCLRNRSSSYHNQAFDILINDKRSCEFVAHKCESYSTLEGKVERYFIYLIFHHFKQKIT